MERMRRALVTALLAVLVAGCATAAPQGPLVPLIGGWEHYFKLEWALGERRGHPIIWGYLLNDWGMAAARVRILVDALDGEGRLVAQQVAWVGPRVITPGTRVYFETPVPAPADAYRVSVFSYDWIDEPSRWPWF
jgi:hypothetical protein